MLKARNMNWAEESHQLPRMKLGNHRTPAPERFIPPCARLVKRGRHKKREKTKGTPYKIPRWFI